MLTRTAWRSACSPPMRSTSATSPCRSTSRSSKRSASTTTSTWCASPTSSAWPTSWARTRPASPKTCTAFWSRVQARTRGKTRLWTSWVCSARRAGACTTGCPPSPSRSAEETLRPRCFNDGRNVKEPSLKPWGLAGVEYQAAAGAHSRSGSPPPLLGGFGSGWEVEAWTGGLEPRWTLRGGPCAGPATPAVLDLSTRSRG